MFSHPFKARNDPPPSYSGPSSYAILNGPTTPIDTEDRIVIVQTPEYIALRKRLCLYIFLSTILLALLIFSMGFAFYTDFENRRLRSEVDICKKGLTRTAGPANATNSLQARGLGGRICFTGYTGNELVLEAALMQEKYGNKDRLWEVPCSETGAFVYPDDVEMEFSYVVLRS